MNGFLEQEYQFLSRITSLIKDFLQQIVEVRTSGQKQKDTISSLQGKLSLEIISNSCQIDGKALPATKSSVRLIMQRN